MCRSAKTVAIEEQHRKGVWLSTCTVTGGGDPRRIEYQRFSHPTLAAGHSFSHGRPIPVGEQRGGAGPGSSDLCQKRALEMHICLCSHKAGLCPKVNCFLLYN
ncbi:hypothetical protein CEXT_750001 [Caerostris extrusa]|uniref:Uncharacterized protein n=1 Tax=Caerostris extrusa TaxID=172846 RepID=A0AAV4XE20_CAEEX|nr:hypothetical protein CEXT_750001 [Caerostris extrusa]